jgi:hypothetical protein
MGCGSSSPAQTAGGANNTANSGREDPSSRRPPPQSSHHQNGGSTTNNSSAIDSQLERARAEEEGKIKMLLRCRRIWQIHDIQTNASIIQYCRS